MNSHAWEGVYGNAKGTAKGKLDCALFFSISTYFTMSHNDNPAIDFLGQIIIAITLYQHIELDHSRLVRRLLILLLLMRNTFRDARHDRDGRYTAADEKI